MYWKANPAAVVLLVSCSPYIFKQRYPDRPFPPENRKVTILVDDSRIQGYRQVSKDALRSAGSLEEAGVWGSAPRK